MANIFSTFVMSETTLNQIKVLPEETQLKFFWAVAHYGIEGIEPDFTGLELAIWIPMRDLILSAKTKDEEWREKQRENGKKGGRPITQPNPNNPWVISETQPNPEEMPKPNENAETHNGNGKDNEKVNVNEKENDNVPQSGEDCFFLSENQKEKPEPLPNKPSTSKEDATTVFQKARVLWNERQLKPECRDLIIPPLHYDCLPTFQNYSWLEIENAIKNYHWHKTGKCGDGWAQPPPYGSIYGFLKTGVSRYFDDDALQSQFKERINGS